MSMLETDEIEQYAVERVRRFFRGKSVHGISTQLSDNDKTPYSDGTITYNGITMPTQIKGTTKTNRTDLKSKKLEYGIKNNLLLIVVCNIPDTADPTPKEEEEVEIKYTFITAKNHELLSKNPNYSSNKNCFKHINMKNFKYDFQKYYEEKEEITLTPEETHEIFTKTKGEIKIFGDMLSDPLKSKEIVLGNVSVLTKDMKFTRKLGRNVKVSFNKNPNYIINNEIIMDSEIIDKNNYKLRYPGIELEFNIANKSTIASGISPKNVFKSEILYKNVPHLNFKNIKTILRYFETILKINFKEQIGKINLLENKYNEVIGQVKKDYDMDLTSDRISNTVRLFFINLYNNDISIITKTKEKITPLPVDGLYIFVVNENGKALPFNNDKIVRINIDKDNNLTMKFSEFILFNSSYKFTDKVINYSKPSAEEIYNLLNKDYNKLLPSYWLNFYENIISLFYENRKVIITLQNRMKLILDNENYNEKLSNADDSNKLIILYVTTCMLLENYSLDEFEMLSKKLNSDLSRSIFYNITKYELKFKEYYKRLGKNDIKTFDYITDYINKITTKENAF